MDSIIDPLREPEFQRALLNVSVVALVAAVVGTFIILRGMAFLGDALAHAIFPGVVAAFLLDANLLMGALVAGVVTTVLIGVLTANERVRDNTAIGVIFTAAFALGVLILTGESIEAHELEEILFGDPLGATAVDAVLTVAFGGAVILAMLVFWRPFVMASFDPNGARAMGLPVLALDVLLLTLTALTVVVSFKAVGNILVIALIITPPATARLFVDRLAPMAALAGLIGVASGIAGLYVGYHAEAAAGGAIVLVATGAFVVAWLLAPRHGMLALALARREGALLRAEPEAVAEVMLASPEIHAPHEA
jgi:manganese/iron transport system permease protein